MKRLSGDRRGIIGVILAAIVILIVIIIVAALLLIIVLLPAVKRGREEAFVED